MISKLHSLAALLIFLSATVIPSAQNFTEDVRKFIDIDDPVVALVGATLIDGTGAPAKRNQTIVFRNRIIDAIGSRENIQLPEGARIIDCSGKTVVPGFVMLHEHMFYTKTFEGQFSIGQMSFTFPRLYLGGGCTTIRTAGSIQPQSDLMIKKAINRGRMAGPKMDVTSPFITTTDVGIMELSGIDGRVDAVDVVNFWADQGCTSFKVYTSITRADLRKVVSAAHARNFKVTGHLCSVTYREAAEIGIDDLEHGFFASSDFVQDKFPDICDPFGLRRSLAGLDVESAQMKSLMQFLIDKGVAVTSTLPVMEPAAGREIVPGGGLDALTPAIREQVVQRYENNVARSEGSAAPENYFKKQMAWEKQFHDMGGLLVVGTDPTGSGRVVPGYANQHIIELLREAGFTVEEAIQISTLHGAMYLEKEDSIGTIEVGKDADLVLIDGDLTESIENIRKMELVFKDGVGFNSQKLFDSVKGKVGMN